MSVSTPSASHSPTCSRTSSTVPTSRPIAERREVHPVEHARRRLLAPSARTGARDRARPRRTTRRARASATPSPDRDRRARTRASNTSSALPVRVGRPRPARVPTVGVFGDEPQQPVALSAHEHTRVRLLRSRPAGSSRRRARWCAPSKVNGPPAEQPRHHFDRFGQAVEAHTRRAASPCRSRRTRARTSRRRARRRGDRRTRDRGSPAPWRAPTPAAAPRRTRAFRAGHVGHPPRERGQRHDRVEARFPIGRAAVLRQIEEQMVGQPHRLEARPRRRARAYSTIVSNRSGRSPATE